MLAQRHRPAKGCMRVACALNVLSAGSCRLALEATPGQLVQELILWSRGCCWSCWRLLKFVGWWVLVGPCGSLWVLVFMVPVFNLVGGWGHSLLLHPAPVQAWQVLGKRNSV